VVSYLLPNTYSTNIGIAFMAFIALFAFVEIIIGTDYEGRKDPLIGNSKDKI
tara:strand:+ start:308 stop:463 length:156 start_codon:yes stop_codon:yes gene_type:complete